MAVNLINSTDIEVVQDGSDIKLEFEDTNLNSIIDGRIANLNTNVNVYKYTGNVDGNPCTTGWVDTLQKTYTFTGLTPNKTYLIIWSCSWVRNNQTESSATSGECKWKTNNGGFTNGVMTAPSGVNQTFTCFGYDTSNASGSLDVSLYSNSGGAWATKTPYFSGLNVLVFGI